MFDIHKKRCSKGFFFELILLLISPIPNFEYYITFNYYLTGEDNKVNPVPVRVKQPVSDIFLAFMLLRVYFLMKCHFNYSIYTDLFSKQLCREHGFYPGVRFILKSKFVKNPE